MANRLSVEPPDMREGLDQGSYTVTALDVVRTSNPFCTRFKSSALINRHPTDRPKTY